MASASRAEGNLGMTTRASGLACRLVTYFKLPSRREPEHYRNWVGQNTEEVFYDLADEYGLLIWNGFLGTTQTTTSKPRIQRCF